MLDVDEIRSCYFTARDVVDDFLENELYTYSRTPLEFLTYFNYENYCKIKYDFEFIPYNFKSLGRFIGGNLQIHDGIVLITYDSNNNVPRQQFTKLHEIYHYFGHYLLGIKGQSFGQSINNEGLDYEDLILEQEADFGASLMQIHDKGIIRCFREKMTFNQMSMEYSMSYSSLHTRLMTYLVFEKDLPQNEAAKLVNGYRYANKLAALKKAI